MVYSFLQHSGMNKIPPAVIQSPPPPPPTPSHLAEHALGPFVRVVRLSPTVKLSIGERFLLDIVGRPRPTGTADARRMPPKTHQRYTKVASP